MARFYVGQRVRVVHVSEAEDNFLVGQEGLVNELDCVNELDEGSQIGVAINGEDDWCFEPWQIEPITDANNLVSWESCAWMPEYLREKA